MEGICGCFKSVTLLGPSSIQPGKGIELGTYGGLMELLGMDGPFQIMLVPISDAGTINERVVSLCYRLDPDISYSGNIHIST